MSDRKMLQFVTQTLCPSGAGKKEFSREAKRSVYQSVYNPNLWPWAPASHQEDKGGAELLLPAGEKEPVEVVQASGEDVAREASTERWSGHVKAGWRPCG